MSNDLEKAKSDAQEAYLLYIRAREEAATAWANLEVLSQCVVSATKQREAAHVSEQAAARVFETAARAVEAAAAAIARESIRARHPEVTDSK